MAMSRKQNTYPIKYKTVYLCNEDVFICKPAQTSFYV